MKPITNPGEAISALRIYERNLALGSHNIPERLTLSLAEAVTKISPVDAAVGGAEALYAFRADLDTEGLELAYRLVSYGNMMGFHNLGGERGTGMVKAILRQMGIAPPLGMEWPAAEEDPEVSESYLVAAPEPQAPVE